MKKVKCPVCGRQNEVGPMPEKKPGERYQTMQPCEHLAYIVLNDPVWDFLHSQLFIEPGFQPELFQYKKQIQSILERYFIFADGAAFGKSQNPLSHTGAAKKDVEKFLKSKGHH